MNSGFKSDLKWSDVTPKAMFLNRRAFIAGAMGLAAAGPALGKMDARPSALSTDAKPNTLEEITSYNNYYEFGYGKEDPAAYAGSLVTDPWTVKVDGLVDTSNTGPCFPTIPCSSCHSAIHLRIASV